MTFTAEQVTEALKASELGADFDYEDVSWDEIWGSQEIEGLGEVKLVENVGGGEGDGEHTHIVIQTVSTGQYFRINGYYSSYAGTNWDGSELYEVTKQTKTVVVYE